MNFNKKIQAFTLSELLIVIVISSIVISLAFSALSMIQKQVSTIQNTLDKTQDIEFLNRSLWSDFNSYNVMYNTKIDALFLSTPIDSFQYAFDENYIIRKKDTIRVSLVNKKLFLDGQDVSSGIIDAMELELTINNSPRKLFIYKNKSATHYLNN